MAPRKAAKASPAAPARGPGRAAKAAASAAIAKEAPNKRGRAVKAEVPAAPDPTPKKRGRPARTKVEEDVDPAPEPEAEQPKKGRGRGRKAAEPVPEPPVGDAPAPEKRGRKPAEPAPEPAVDDAPAPAPKKRAGRPRKATPPAAKAPATHKRRGRPSASALDLNRVTGPARISKRRSSTKTAPPAIGTRSSPRNSRTRASKQPKKAPAAAVAPKQKAAPKAKKAAPKEAPLPKKRMGRPPKNAAATSSKKTPTKPADHKRKDARVAKSTPKPRKKRGYTTIDVPDRFADAMIDYLQQLIDTKAAPAKEPTEEAPADDEEVDVDVVMSDAEDAEAALTNGDIAKVDVEDEASAQLEDEEEPILVIEEVVEEVIGDNTESQELDRATEDDDIMGGDLYDDDDDDDDEQYAAQDKGDLGARSDALQAAHEAASDTELDDDPIVYTETFEEIQGIQEIKIRLLGRESVIEEAIEKVPDALDLQQEIQEITESAPEADPDHTFDSLFEERPPAGSQVDDLDDSSDGDDDEATSLPTPGTVSVPSSFGFAPVAHMLPTAPDGS